MRGLENGTLLIKTRKLEETAEHVSRLTIRCMLNGEQYYKVGGHDHLVHPNNFLIVNQGQLYKTAFEGIEEKEMLLVAFKPEFAESLLHSFVTPEDNLLEEPFYIKTQPVLFFEQTYDADPVITHYFTILRKLVDEDIGIRKEIDLEHIYTQLLTRLLQLHRMIDSQMDHLHSTKKGTRVELYRRLHIARDYMDAHACEKIGLDIISREACLSVHHFKRAFRDLFGISPHQYLIRKRINKAELLLHHSPLTIEYICKATGFENVSSFIRLFREHTGSTPGKIRTHKLALSAYHTDEISR
jgi:AraC-like DNA-binding protein